MNISSINSGSFGKLYSIMRQNQYISDGQVELFRLINSKIDDNPASDDNLLENLENICGADVYVMFGDDDTVTLTARKRTPAVRSNNKVEEKFYEVMSKFNDNPLVAKPEKEKLNEKKIDSFCKYCKTFVNKIIASGNYIS